MSGGEGMGVRVGAPGLKHEDGEGARGQKTPGPRPTPWADEPSKPRSPCARAGHCDTPRNPVWTQTKTKLIPHSQTTSVHWLAAVCDGGPPMYRCFHSRVSWEKGSPGLD